MKDINDLILKYKSLNKKDKYYLYISFISVLLSSIATIFTPFIIMFITDTIAIAVKPQNDGQFLSIDIEKIKFHSLVLILIYTFIAVMDYLQNLSLNQFIHNFTSRLRHQIAHKITMLPMSYFDQHLQGDTLSLMLNDVNAISQALNQTLSIFLSSFLILIGSILMMLTVNIKLSLISIFTVSIGFSSTLYFTKYSQRAFNNQQSTLAEANNLVDEAYTNHEVLVLYNALNQSINNFKNINQKLYKTSYKTQLFSGFISPFVNFIGNFSYVLITVYGFSLVLNKILSIGEVIAFMSYVRLFSQPLSQFSELISYLQTAKAAKERLLSFLNQKEMITVPDLAINTNQIKGEIKFNSVSFGYNKKETTIKSFNLHIKPGQKIAIVGSTGSGKTTLINLLMKFYDHQKGDIIIDRYNIQDIPAQQVHDLITMVLQDSWLFNMSIKNNLTYGQMGIKQIDIENATKKVGIHDFINDLPNGYDTILNEKINLSSGQKQLLTIARALLKPSPILILDEATSSIDHQNEKNIQEAIKQLTANKTSIVIAHRLSTIQDADTIIVLKNGKIIEQGNHTELLHIKGNYYNMYYSQFKEDGEPAPKTIHSIPLNQQSVFLSPLEWIFINFKDIIHLKS